jgi:hypothetical protein
MDQPRRSRRPRPINKKGSKTNRNRSNRRRKYLGDTHRPTKSMQLVPFSGQELTGSSINEKELTLRNISSSSRIFKGFYNSMHSIFPDLDESRFSEVFLMFITTTDFSEFLQFMPDFKDLSVLEMNKYMVVASELLRKNVMYEITGKSIGPTSTHGNQLRIMTGGDIGDIIAIMVHMILATLVAIGLPLNIRYIFVGLIICFFVFNIRNRNDFDAGGVFTLLAIEGSVVALAGIQATYGWVRRIFGYARNFFTSGRVEDLTHQTVRQVERQVEATLPSALSPRRPRLSSKVASKPQSPS